VSNSALTISYSEKGRNTQTNAIDVILVMSVTNNKESSWNMVYDNFYLAVDGVEVPSISQTQGNAYIDPHTTRETELWIRVEEIGTNYKLNYRNNSLNIEWVKADPAQTPKPPYAVTLQYKETTRRSVTSDDVKGEYTKYVGYTFIQIGITAQSNDGKSHVLTYENFYLTVNGVETTPEMQLKGTWGFDGKSESEIWMIFKEIGVNYDLTYRDNSFTIEWIKQ
jgi:hypothetical protein